VKKYIEANLKFIIPQTSKPFFESSEYTGTVPRVHFKTEYKQVPILDIRNNAASYTFDKNGFQLLNHKSHVKDFYNHNEVKKVYGDELKIFLIKHFKANEVFIFDYTRRSDGIKGAKNPDGLRGPADRLHADYTAASGPQRAKDVIGDKLYDKIILQGGRIIQLNIWRPINGPIKRSPLAFADASSIPKKDLIETDQIFSNRTGEIYHIAYSEEHKWYWASNMRNEEVLLLKGWDSLLSNKIKYTPHGAFEIPCQEDNATPRESIEARVFIVFKK
jgi:hypothetical protein